MRNLSKSREAYCSSIGTVMQSPCPVRPLSETQCWHEHAEHSLDGAGVVRRWQIGGSGAVMMGRVIASPDRHAVATRVRNAHTRRMIEGSGASRGRVLVYFCGSSSPPRCSPLSPSAAYYGFSVLVGRI